MTSHEVFGEDYFERGIEKHISGYTDYRWKPEYVLPMANWLKNNFGRDNVFLDYGCAKGFLVKALRLLGLNAYGYDISEYAIKNAELEVKDYVSTNINICDPDVIVMKDVLEHIDDKEIDGILENFVANWVIAIIPLGDDNKFRIREYELDITHITKKDEVWWINKFNKADYDLEEFYYSLPGIKDNWTSKYPYGNGIFIFHKR